MKQMLFTLAIAVLLATGVMGGCDATFTKLDSGAERVLVTTNPAQVAEAKLLDTGWCQLGPLLNQTARAHNYARNFTFRVGGNIALIKTTVGGAGQYGPQMYVTVEAYRAREH